MITFTQAFYMQNFLIEMEYFQCGTGSFTEAKSTQVHHWLSLLYWKHFVDLSGAGRSDDTSPCRFLAFPKMENVSKHTPPKIPPGGSSASVI